MEYIVYLQFASKHCSETPVFERVITIVASSDISAIEMAARALQLQMDPNKFDLTATDLLQCYVYKRIATFKP